MSCQIECCICYENQRRGEEVKLECGHDQFCYYCIAALWQEIEIDEMDEHNMAAIVKCPLCRRQCIYKIDDGEFEYIEDYIPVPCDGEGRF